MTQPRVLFYDLETSLQLVTVFQLAHNDWIDPSAIVQERYVICASWSWEGEDEVHSVSVLDSPKRYRKNPYDDFYVMQKLHKVISSADCIVAHNGDQFDKKYVDTRMLYHGLAPLPPVTSVDTYKTAKSRFLFNSNKLNYLGTFLGLGEKIQTTPGLWMRVLNGDSDAVLEMVEYNKQDVRLLKDVFYKLRPYMNNYMNRELFGGIGCPRCGSTHVQSRGVHRAITRSYRRYQCQNPDCMGWFRDLRTDKNTTTPHRVL